MRHSKMRQLEFNQFGAAAVKPIFNDQLSVSMNISTLSDFFLRIFFIDILLDGGLGLAGNVKIRPWGAF